MCAARGASARAQPIGQGGEDVVGVFEADREADQLGLEALFALFLVGDLRVRRGSRVDDEALRIADVREDREERHGVHQLARLRTAALHAEDDHAAGAVRQVLLRKLRFRQRRVAHPCQLRMVGEEFRDLERVGGVLRRAERQRLDPLQEDPRRVGGERRTLVAQPHGAEAQDEREVER